MGLFGLWAPMQTATGPITPLIFLAAMLLTLPTAISYALLNSRLPSAGAACTWLWKCAGPTVGLQAGLLMTTYFMMAAIAQPLMFALFFRDLLSWLHIEWPALPTLIIGVIVATLPTGWICLRGAGASIKSTLGLMLIESLVVVALSATILIVKSSTPGEITLSSFDPRQATHGLSGGFDVVSSAAEEARAPRDYVPKAILLTIIGISLFWTLNAWVLTLSTPIDKVQEYTYGGLTAVTPVAQAYWGWGSLAVILTAFTGLTAVYISSVQGASRIVFALARHGFLPATLMLLSHPRRVPRNAIVAVLASTVMLDIVTIYLLENGLDGFTWWANALVFFATLTFLSVNLSNFLYFIRYAPDEFHWIKNGLVPLTGILLNAYLLYAAFFSSLWSANIRTGKSVVATCLVLLAAQLVAVLFIRSYRPSLVLQPPPLHAEQA